MLIAQISDLHILRDPSPENAVLAHNASRLIQTIELICSMRPLPDVVFVTGDVSHEGTAEDYAYCRKLLEKLPCPFFVVPGNHDDRALLREVFPINTHLSDSAFYQFECDSYPLRIIGIDTLEVGKVGGELCQARVDWARGALLRSDKPAVILMHHPPYSFGNVENPDMQCTRGAEQLSDIIKNNGNVAAILCGHLHLHTNSVWAGVKALTAPSVSPAFKLEIEGTRTVGWCPSSPALALHFHSNHGTISHIVRVEDSKVVHPL